MKQILSLIICVVGMCAQAQFNFSDLAFMCPPTSQSFVPDILWWKMNDGSGTTMTASVGPNGTNDATWATGKSGSGFSLDANGTTGDGQSVSSVTYGTNIITVAFWLNNDTNLPTYRVFAESGAHASGGNRFLIYFDPSVTNVAVYSSGTTGKREELYTSPSLVAWHHMLAVYNNSTGEGDVRLFVDGAELTALSVRFNTKTGTANFVADTLFIMSRNRGALFMDGKIDDLRIYSGDQSANVSAIMNDPK